ncbi:MAG: cyclase family protein [Planctomycetota bacterium]
MARLVDLSHPLADGQVGFPTDPPLCIAQHTTVASHQFNLSRIEIGSHHGTHLDAMYHFLGTGKTVDQMPLDWFYGPARVLRIPKGASEEITAADLLPHEEYLKPEARILLDTGWHREFGTARFFSDFPSLTVAAARYLAGRRIRLLGMDMPTPGRQWLEIHHSLLAPEIEMVLVEALANLDELPDEFIFAGFPLPLQGGDGSPIRAVGIC